MKVAEITGEPLVHGGQEVFILNLLRHITDPEIQIDVIAPYNCYNHSFEEMLSLRGGKLIQLGLHFARGKSRKSLLKPLYKTLKRENYDVIHIHSGSISALAYCALAANRAGCRRVIVHSHLAGIPSFKHRMVQLVFSPLLTVFATDWLACSRKAGEDKYSKSIVEKKLIVIKNGIELQEYQRNNALGQETRKELGIAPNAFVIGHVGRFSYEKNQLFLVDVFADVHNKNPRSCLLLIGDGELEAVVKERVSVLGLNHCVYFTGATDHVSTFYNVMDCFAFPSLFEGLGYVLVEAQANGLPCLISDSLPDDAMVNSNVNKLPLQKELWTENLLKIKLQDCIADQSALIKAGFSVHETVKTMEAIYRRL